jgi:fructose-bisphosphate aldolase class 1
LQQSALKKWSENTSDKAGTLSVFDHRAYMNSLASTGAWDASQEKTS